LLVTDGHADRSVEDAGTRRRRSAACTSLEN
jgi:hypothetical protein